MYHTQLQVASRMRLVLLGSLVSCACANSCGDPSQSLRCGSLPEAVERFQDLRLACNETNGSVLHAMLLAMLRAISPHTLGHSLDHAMACYTGVPPARGNATSHRPRYTCRPWAMLVGRCAAIQNRSVGRSSREFTMPAYACTGACS